jgi:hypothetical protein
VTWCSVDVPVECVEGVIDRMEVDYLLEEVEAIVAEFIIREESY